MSSPLDRLRHHVTGAIERGEAEAITEVRGPTQHNVVPGNWASVSGGKWHLVHEEHPTFRQPVTSLCGITFEPLNVTWGEAPPTNDHWVCKKCISRK